MKDAERRKGGVCKLGKSVSALLIRRERRGIPRISKGENRPYREVRWDCELETHNKRRPKSGWDGRREKNIVCRTGSRGMGKMGTGGCET